VHASAGAKHHLPASRVVTTLQASSAATADDATIDISQLDVAAVMLDGAEQGYISLPAALHASSAAKLNHP
jgi:hypothetical protein